MTINWKPITDAQKVMGSASHLAPCFLVTRLPCTKPNNPPYAIVRWARVTNSRFWWKYKGQDIALEFTPTHYADLDIPSQ